MPNSVQFDNTVWSEAQTQKWWKEHQNDPAPRCSPQYETRPYFRKNIFDKKALTNSDLRDKFGM